MTLDDITNKLVYKELVALRDARIDQLLAEREEAERAAKERAREATRNQILQK